MNQAKKSAVPLSDVTFTRPAAYSMLNGLPYRNTWVTGYRATARNRESNMKPMNGLLAMIAALGLVAGLNAAEATPKQRTDDAAKACAVKCKAEAKACADACKAEDKACALKCKAEAKDCAAKSKAKACDAATAAKAGCPAK